MTRSKAFRRFQKEKKIKKAFHLFKLFSFRKRSDEELMDEAKRRADNMKNTKCECCCNPRHSKLFKNKKTIQEKKAPDIEED